LLVIVCSSLLNSVVHDAVQVVGEEVIGAGVVEGVAFDSVRRQHDVIVVASFLQNLHLNQIRPMGTVTIQ